MPDPLLDVPSRRASGPIACALGAVAWLLAGIALAGPVAAPARVAAAASSESLVPAAPPELVEQGRRMYVEGVRPDGTPLTAKRLAASMSGPVAACIQCHRRSGMGGTEGDIIVPPINGPSLYAGSRLRDRVIISMDPRRGRSFNQSHPPYDDASLLAAIRDGRHATGRDLSELMPRYRISQKEFAALKAYLDQLSSAWSPGVTDTNVRFATVITPDVSPVRRDAFLKSIRAMFDQKNSNTLPGHRHMISASEGMLNLERHWDLDVWELTGPPDTWPAQLQAAYDRSPVFAIASGIGDGEWGPVQAFCERGHIPCWFPSVVAPPENAAHEVYGLYFSAGVGLEASVLGQSLRELPPGEQPRRIVAIGRDEAAVRAGIAALGRDAGPWKLESRVLGSAATPTLAAALAGLGPRDAVMLWLRPADLAELPGDPPSGRVYASAILGGAESAPVSGSWRSTVRLVYPYELPQKRVFDMATFHSWIELRKLPLVDEPMQSEVFFSINYLMFTMTDMLDNVYRDCLIDRGEVNVRRREMLRAEEETMVRQGGHPPAKRVAAASTYAPGAIYGTDAHSELAQSKTPLGGERQGTTIYPHLSLGIGQRYASKGAYIVRFGADGVLVPESGWISP